MESSRPSAIEPIDAAAWPNLDATAEAMEILDPSPELDLWHGARPGWATTTIYAAPQRDTITRRARPGLLRLRAR